MIEEMFQKRRARDLIRDRLVRMLALYELPDELRALREEDAKATEEWETAFILHREFHRESSKSVFSDTTERTQSAGRL